MEPMEQAEQAWPPPPNELPPQKVSVQELFKNIISNESRRRVLRENLEVLLHAKGCQIREAQYNIKCYLPHCASMKRIIDHLRGCKAGYKCSIPFCTVARLIINHWKNCNSGDCGICSPIRQRAERQRNAERVAEEAANRQHPPRGALRKKFARG